MIVYILTRAYFNQSSQIQNKNPLLPSVNKPSPIYLTNHLHMVLIMLYFKDQGSPSPQYPS